MKLDDISAFVAVVHAGSVSQAARDLRLTQPAVTRRVQNLEEALGTPLLDRHTKPPRPSAAGLRVYERCQAVLHEVGRLNDAVGAGRAPTGTLRLGLTQGIVDVVLRGAIEDLRERFPAVSTSISTGWSGPLAERVSQGELEAAAVWFGRQATLPKNVQGEQIEQSPLVVVARRADIVRRTYRLSEWSDRGWVLNPDGCGFRAGLKRALDDRGLPFVLRMDTTGRELQLEMVARGHGLGLVPRPLLAASAHAAVLGAVPLSDFKPEVGLWLLRHRSSGGLQGPIDRFGLLVGQALGARSGATRQAARGRAKAATPGNA